MARTIDTQSLYGQREHADVTVKCGYLEVPCHKVILSLASEYFKGSLNSIHNFREAREGVIELQDVAPEAVEAMLRWLYGYEYQNIVGQSQNPLDPLYHLKVYKAADKYLMPDLMTEAVAALENALIRMSAHVRSSGDEETNVQAILNYAKALEGHKNLDVSFMEKATRLIQAHLPALMKLESFRAWLDEDENPALPVVLRAVGNGAQATRITPQTCFVCQRIHAVNPGGYPMEQYLCGRTIWRQLAASEWIFEEGRPSQVRQ